MVIFVISILLIFSSFPFLSLLCRYPRRRLDFHYPHYPPLSHYLISKSFTNFKSQQACLCTFNCLATQLSSLKYFVSSCEILDWYFSPFVTDTTKHFTSGKWETRFIYISYKRQSFCSFVRQMAQTLVLQLHFAISEIVTVYLVSQIVIRFIFRSWLDVWMAGWFVDSY